MRGSDPGQHGNTCKLCLAQAELRQSHIVPEWCYRPAYDEKHRALVKSTEFSATKFIQKGWREFLLCQNCETLFSKWESWFCTFWNESPGLPADMIGKTTEQHLFSMDGVDYAPLKLFHLSILWRASAANRREFDNVSLGPYEEKLRHMLLAEDPGPEDHYPIYGIVLTNDDGSVVHEMVSKPQRADIPRVTVYYFVYAGCEWTYYVTDHPDSLDRCHREVAREMTVRTGKSLRLLVRPFQDCNTIKIWREQAGSS